MKAAVFAFTRRGCDVAERMGRSLGACRMFTMEKFLRPGFEAYRPPLAAFVEPLFREQDYLIFVGSTGMAVRAIAPWVKDKKTDPGVLVADEGGHFVISLLSGHIGGANDLARQLAEALGATPVVTTATDVRGRFSVDQWAAQKGLHIGSMAAAKAVSAGILEGDVPLKSDFPIVTSLPPGVIPGEDGPLGIYIGYRKASPFETTLRLTPKVLRLGIGCRRGVEADAIRQAVEEILEETGICREALLEAASIDLKAEEPGLLEFCEAWGLPVSFHTSEELREVPGEFPVSEFVRSVTGVDNVCQRAALLKGGRLILEKTPRHGVTVSLAEQNWEVEF